MTAAAPLNIPLAPAAASCGVDEAALSGWLKALGEPRRLRIFRLLLQSELCVCELEEQVKLAPSLLAHHLKALRLAGLIAARRGVKDARWLYYSVNPAAYRQLCQFVSGAFPPQELPAAARCGSNCRCG